MSLVIDAIGSATSAWREYKIDECVASRMNTELERRSGSSTATLRTCVAAACNVGGVVPGTALVLELLLEANAGDSATAQALAARHRNPRFQFTAGTAFGKFAL